MANQNTEFADYERNEEASAYILRLFITGASPNSIRAVENINTICEKYLKGNYDLKIIDIHQQPELAQGEDIVALPLLIKKAPGTERRMIGDMSDTNKVLRGLGLPELN
ncbi:circadian clock KaiB family protein [Mucilaginibacter sp. ZT4R22]|uniref:Circadian clock KaiB family protein n=1 Tax=Mucilaginibacter pankratovii TaxID=2772110 RepID=A0ABR7WXU0_9SPHI|nr:circadian clock KaiB family protein [Mucilaginibacter pankratovii]MBD1367110.1 circadian clock KaiB family protein [Mucilaginibacter pankratovii]